MLDTILYHQARNASAAKSHAKTRKMQLREMGIDRRRLRRCPARI
ncbi:MAG: hypothetical protein ACYTDU_19030 [Planctomycetota bacterium]